MSKRRTQLPPWSEIVASLRGEGYAEDGPVPLSAFIRAIDWPETTAHRFLKNLDVRDADRQMRACREREREELHGCPAPALPEIKPLIVWRTVPGSRRREGSIEPMRLRHLARGETDTSRIDELRADLDAALERIEALERRLPPGPGFVGMRRVG